MSEFLYNYGWVILIVFIFVARMVYIYRRDGKEMFLRWLKVEAYKLMLVAEKEWERDKGFGKTKFNFVLKRLYVKLPRSLLYFITYEEVAKILEKWYQAAKQYLTNASIDISAYMYIDDTRRLR